MEWGPSGGGRVRGRDAMSHHIFRVGSKGRGAYQSVTDIKGRGTQGEGVYQSVTGTKGRGTPCGPKGWGTVMSHPFQGGGWTREEGTRLCLC